jgi:hypothetical protein
MCKGRACIWRRGRRRGELVELVLDMREQLAYPEKARRSELRLRSTVAMDCDQQIS